MLLHSVSVPLGGAFPLLWEKCHQGMEPFAPGHLASRLWQRRVSGQLVSLAVGEVARAFILRNSSDPLGTLGLYSWVLAPSAGLSRAELPRSIRNGLTASDLNEKPQKEAKEQMGPRAVSRLSTSAVSPIIAKP